MYLIFGITARLLKYVLPKIGYTAFNYKPAIQKATDLIPFIFLITGFILVGILTALFNALADCPDDGWVVLFFVLVSVAIVANLFYPLTKTKMWQQFSTSSTNEQQDSNE